MFSYFCQLNIRILKQSIHEFKRFFDVNLFKNDDDLFENILINYLIFSIENKKNLFDRELFKFKNDDKDVFYSKYNINEYSTYILDKLIWNDIVVNNILDVVKISENLESNYFSYKIDKPEWYKLWHYYDLNNADFVSLLNSSIKKLDCLEYKDFGEVFHVVCAVLYFNQNFVIPFDLDEVKIKAFKNIESICKKMNRSELDKYIKFEDKDHWGGYSYLGYDLELIRSFIKEAIEKIKEFKNSMIEKEADELFQLLYTNSSLFLHRICLTNSEDNIYFNVPILKEIQPEEFSKTLLELKLDTIKKVLSALEARYNVDKSIIEDILVEKEWLEEVLKNLIHFANQKTSIEKYKIDNILIKRINHILKEFLN